MVLRASLHLIVVLSLVTPLAATTGQDREAEADALLERAEEEVVRGRYDRAIRIFRTLAEDYPDTAAGGVGVERSHPSAYLGAVPLVAHGPRENRVDVALMGDGYTLDHLRAFDELAEDVPGLIERQEPFREYYSYFNFHRLVLVSADGGVDGFGREEDTALGGYTRGTIQGHVSVDPAAVQGALSEAGLSDGLALVFVRTGVLGTGVAGIGAVGGRDARTTIHEWGHAFARLGDEYAEKTTDRGGVSTRPNLSPTDDESEVPWAHWLEARVPGIGVYEGAGGQVRGAWKPTASGCVMETGEFFCRPCTEAIVLRVYSLVDPIDSTSFPPYPFDHTASLEVADEFELEVHVLRPASHALEVRWWILPESEAPRSPADPGPRYARELRGDRTDRGPLPPIAAKPDAFSRVSRTGVHRFKIEARDLEPGRYRVVCRARDTTRLRGARYPLVLKDEDGVLESERAWWVRIPER